MGIRSSSFSLYNGPFCVGDICIDDLMSNVALTRPDAHNRSLRPSEQKFWQKLTSYPKVKRVIYSDPATIVLWDDGTKSVVMCMDGQPFDKYAGFCSALAKKVFGSTSKAKKIAGAKEKPVKVEAEEVANEEPVADESVIEFQYTE